MPALASGTPMPRGDRLRVPCIFHDTRTLPCDGGGGGSSSSATDERGQSPSSSTSPPACPPTLLELSLLFSLREDDDRAFEFKFSQSPSASNSKYIHTNSLAVFLPFHCFHFDVRPRLIDECEATAHVCTLLMQRMMSDSRALVVLDDNQVPKDEAPNGGQSAEELILYGSKKLQDDLESLGLRIKQHEENIRSLKAQKSKLDDAILDKQVLLGNYHSRAESKISDGGVFQPPSEDGTVDQVLRHEKPAAGLICQLEAEEVGEPCHRVMVKDVLGVVAALGKVVDATLGSFLAEYLGADTMLAVVCKTYEGVKALETYDSEGCIDKSSGLHGLGASVGRPINGRFMVICLENLRPYTGDFVYDDPQRKLNLLKPRLPDGQCPAGFLGFAVNMIEMEATHLQYLTEYGHGLRETLFYHLFRRTQVYKTRAEMMNALPFINDGAISLDGGVIRGPGVYPLGAQEDVPVRFSIASGSKYPVHYYETEKEMKDLKWKREKLLEDVQRERQLLDHAKLHFERKKQEFVKFLAHSSTYAAAQQQVQMGRDPLTPRCSPAPNNGT
ncbi:hypothetical protein CRG98_012811 [Punica granatum]|uniref:Protein DEFECTIVE IN MERISTEM SILENCING 3 n=2 Tax=Punica granatum TaxID=22663 RepID=A0A2I0KE64_PUNGR|nr:hypothetical protein CRG98_012811 [Punica granatum]